MKNKFRKNNLVGLIGILFIACATVSNASELADEVILTSNNVYVPETCISALSKQFQFDWSKNKANAFLKNNVTKIELLLKKNKSFSALNETDKAALGGLFNKLGAYYIFVEQKPEIAIKKLNQSPAVFMKKNDLAWNDVLLAYAYAQKYATSGVMLDKESAINYLKKLRETNNSLQYKQQIALAYYVDGMLQKSDKNFVEAESSYKKSYEMYVKIGDQASEQFVTVKQALKNNAIDELNWNNQVAALLNYYYSNK